MLEREVKRNKLVKKYRFRQGDNVKSKSLGIGIITENLGNYLYLVNFNGIVKKISESYIDFA